MKKVLTYITQEDADSGIMLNSLLATYKSLLEISSYHMNANEINSHIADCKQKIDKFWDYLLEKYKLPYYLNYVMKIDHENPSIYINE